MIYPPWAGWYNPWTPPPMHFHLGCPGPAGSFCHKGYYARDGHYAGVGQHQTRWANRIVQNAKPNHSVPMKTTEAPGQPDKESMQGLEDARRSGVNHDQTRPRSETLANDKAMNSMQKGPEEVAVKQNKAQGNETEIRAEAIASS
jgi:hypothetical protein